MQKAFVVATVAVALLLAAGAASAMHVRDAALQAQFKQFMAKYNVHYATEAEEARRFAAFVENMKIAAQRQAENPLATFGAGPYADRTRAEMKMLHNLDSRAPVAHPKTRKLPTATRPSLATMASTPASVDWRTKGAVTPIKNQGLECGSCYSFSVTGNIEGQWFLAGHPLTSLSEQEIVSCDTIDGGCGGGLPDDVFEWLLLLRNGSIAADSAYPYVSGNGVVPTCNPGPYSAIGAQIVAYQDIPRNEDVMASYTATQGPLSIGVDATSFETYISGILTNCESVHIDHAVLIVGYDNTNNPPYWIVKNSWGPTWGEAGYIRVAKGSNQCLIKNMPTTAIVNPAGPTQPPAPTQPTTPTPQGPTTPAPQVPPQPPAPTAPAPTTGSVTQLVCTDPFCQSCNSTQLPQNVCVQTSAGGSALLSCDASLLLQIAQFNSTNCVGANQTNFIPTGVCEPDTAGSFVEFTCTSSGSQSGAASSASGSA